MSKAKAETNARPGSGVFIRPVWRRKPSRVEQIGALVMTGLVLVGAACLPQIVGEFYGGDAPGTANEAAIAVRRAFELSRAAEAKEEPSSAEDSSSRAGAPEAPRTARPGPYSIGRKKVAESIAAGMTSMKESVSLRVFIIILSVALALGIILGFFGWHLRRLTAALGGALLLGGIAFALSRSKPLELHWVSALFVALPMATCGALLGWHLVVLFTCMQAGSLAASLVTGIFLHLYGVEAREWMIVCYLVTFGLGTTIAYLFAARALLISGWAVWGALLLTLAMLLGIYGFTDLRPPWEGIFVPFALFALVGTITQYHLAARAAEDAPEPVAKPA